MNLLNQMTIKNRMIFAGIFMALLFFLFGIISINQMNRLGELTATLYEHPLQVSNAALKAKAGVIRMDRGMKEVTTSTTRLSATLAIQAVVAEEKKVYAELALIRDLILGEEGKALVEETNSLFARWKPIRVEVEELVLRGDHAAANKITREKGADYVVRLERNIAALTAYAIKKADGFMADARKTQDRILNNALVFVFIMILSGLGIGVFMSASILSSISALKETMTTITGSGELKEAQLEGNNEITEMAGHFNDLILRLKRQFWLGDGRNSLNRDLSGELTYDEILEKSIQAVCRYTHACAGAAYRFNTEEETCELKSSYALVERTHLGNRFPLGHGIVGQVALERKPILLKDISKKDALGRSATINQAPEAIYALPLVHQDKLYGVMETASFEAIDPIKQKYLESAAQTIALFLHSASQRDRIRQLLDLSRAANEKLKDQTRELQSQTAELTALNEEFQQQSHELKAQNLALEDQRIQVEEANRLKSEFLSNMSHELRTPLNSVNALSRVLMVQAKEKLSTEELNYLSIIERNGKHLLSLINDILDLSKIEAGRMEVIEGEFSVNTMVETILDSLAPIAREKGIGLETDPTPNLPWMVSDESRVFQILQNIIANAVKFTEIGQVRVKTYMENQDIVCIRVQDTGIGISTRDLDGIFEEFRQADGASTRKFEGSGLGLSIAYKSATLLGGDIHVDSIPDQGTTFCIYLPLRYQGPAPVPGSPTVPPASPLEPVYNEAATILAVDDDPKILSLISGALTKGGYNCITAGSGREALDLAKTHKPAAITLDILMPDMDGWEVLSELKKDLATKEIPVIIVSVSHDRATGFALGAVGYVTKPIGKETLLTQIKQLFTTLPSRVLVVDDSPLDREHTSDILEAQGIEVTTAENGRTCMDMLIRETPDLVVLDLVMPEMDGFKVLKLIRDTPDTRHLPVIVVSAKDLSQEEKQLLESQVSAVLTKGISPESALVEKINQILSAAGKRVAPVRETDPGAKTILLVEDNEAAVIQVQTALNTLGVNVKIAMNGRQALDRIGRDIPDGIILDLMMPEVDGFQVLESIRSAPETRDIPVLILTAKDLTSEDLAKLKANQARHLIQKGDVDQDELIRQISEMVAPLPAPEIPPASKPIPKAPESGAKPLVLVVEDNPDNMITIKAILGPSCAVIGAYDGKQGLDKAVSILPDLILLDMSLPVMDGFAVVKTLKSDDRTKGIPVIALTAQAMKGDRKKILAAGCDDYVSKPVDPDIIMKTLAKWVVLRK